MLWRVLPSSDSHPRWSSLSTHDVLDKPRITDALFGLYSVMCLHHVSCFSFGPPAAFITCTQSAVVTADSRCGLSLKRVGSTPCQCGDARDDVIVVCLWFWVARACTSAHVPTRLPTPPGLWYCADDVSAITPVMRGNPLVLHDMRT